MNLGGVTASNGIVDLLATGATSDITLGASISATNSGLTVAQPGIRAVAGRDLLLASTTGLTTLGSGGITLQAARDVNLKVNDGGNNGSANSIQAVGNLDITAGSGQTPPNDHQGPTVNHFTPDPALDLVELLPAQGAHAVEGGRSIYDNIITFVRFQLTTNISAIITIGVAGVAVGSCRARFARAMRWRAWSAPWRPVPRWLAS